jgi:DGQHR domain-containing protein
MAPMQTPSILRKNPEIFSLPVVMMINLTVEEKAYVFSTINSNQEKVSKSLIYDLFDVSSYRSPQKTAHLLARTMNNSESSPWYNRLKMLGKKREDQDLATLSQGTFAKSIISLISRNPDYDARQIKLGKDLDDDSRCIFRKYFIQNRDEVIARSYLTALML